MQLYDATQLGIDLLSELSFGWHLTQTLDSSGFEIKYRPDGTTPVNVISGFSWIDDLERKDAVRLQDYTDYQHQLPLPLISFDFISDTNESLELGTHTKTKRYILSVIVAAENKPQVVNLGGFISHYLEISNIPIYNDNVVGLPKIGVIYCDDVISTRNFNVFAETNLAKNYSMSVTCDAIAEYDNNFER